MAEKLIIRLGSHIHDPVHWLVWSNTETNIIASGELASASLLAELHDKSLTRQVLVLVPACDVALKQLKVPAKSKKAMQLAAPFMLEDDLAQDVEQLFFAYGDVKSADNQHNCFMAAIERQQMQLWLSWLADANIKVLCMLPDALALPDASDKWQAIQLGQQVILRQGDWQGITVDASLWPNICQTFSSEAIKVIESYSPLPEADVALEIESQPEELPLALMAQQLSGQKINLLQGEFAVKSDRSPLLKTWAWAAGFLVVALLVNVMLKSLTLMKINQQQVEIEQQIVATYKQAFPETRRVRIATIRSQLKRKMRAVGSGDHQAEFLALLAKVQPAFAAVPQLKPDSLRFDGKRNELRLQATADGYQQFEQFKVQLESQQLSVSQGTQNNQGDKVTGAFSIKASNGGRS
ncbi:type II secretion system protein GspL [Thalassotalea sp. G2M2-11]|uniref:type II secretion system protein GspL n=1 Tax=Thalassotalea sp. G2M2-11 TaxID=2787627 RepID=UPI0019D0D977|nr:type II secretion system protein GspL [Thalassotalea sp. G2M2-11]